MHGLRASVVPAEDEAHHARDPPRTNKVRDRILRCDNLPH